MFKTLLCVMAVLLAHSAGAQNYPNQPIRMIAPFPPGGSVDIMARLISEPLAHELGGERIRNQARHDVDAAARREGRDHPDRLVGIALRGGLQRQGEEE